ncbi:hypothetical protein RKD30_003573 [Streptomyces pristinaespiralis]
MSTRTSAARWSTGEFRQGGQELPVEIMALGGSLCRLVRLQELLQALRVVHGRGPA